MRLANDFYRIETYEECKSGAVVRLKLNSEHVIYRAHFPNQPVTPGVCMIEMLTELMEKRIGKPLFLCKVRNIKFLNKLSPAAVPVISISFSYQVETGETAKYAVKGEIFGDEQIFAKLSVTYE